WGGTVSETSSLDCSNTWPICPTEPSHHHTRRLGASPFLSESVHDYLGSLEVPIMSTSAVEETHLPTETNLAPTLDAMPIHARLVSIRGQDAYAEFSAGDAEELATYIAEARRLEEPASRDDRERVGRSLEALFPSPDLSVDARQERLWEWCGDLADVPLDV